MDIEQQAGMNEKDKVIAKIYHGREGGQPAHKTWLEAKAINPSITLDWTKSWFKLNIQPTRQVGGAQNSYVAPRAYHEYQADVFYITAKQFKNQDFPYGLSVYDVFSKYAAVIPMTDRTAKDIMEALFQAFKQMGKQPEILYTDDEGALNTKWVAGEFERAGIQHIVAGTAYFVERFNRTFKKRMAMLMDKLLKKKRITGKQPEIEKIQYQWSDLIPHIMAEYNTKSKHRITGMTPLEARKPSSEADAKTAMEMVAIRGRKFPILQVGDTVRILKKKKVVGDKEFMEQFKQGKHKVESISENVGQKFYMLSDKREHIRSDIVKMIN